MMGQGPVPQQVCPEPLSPRGSELCFVARRKKSVLENHVTSCWLGGLSASDTPRGAPSAAAAPALLGISPLCLHLPSVVTEHPRCAQCVPGAAEVTWQVLKERAI